MYKKFFEYKLSNENWSKYYYLVFRFDERTLQGLSDGEFKGLNAISENIEIVNRFFDVRPMMLIMDKTKVEDLNEIEKFNYYDIDYLCKDNFKNFKRVLDYDDEYDIDYILYQSFRKADRFLGELLSRNRSKNSHYIKLRKLISTSKYLELFGILDGYSSSVLKRIKSVKNFDDFISQFYREMYGEKIWDKIRFTEYNDKKMIRNCFEFLIINHASLFEKEGEVLVKSDTFTIPEKSVLLIKDTLFSDDYHATSNKILMTQYNDKLKEIYKLKLIKFNKNYKEYLQTFALARYLDKIKYEK